MNKRLVQGAYCVKGRVFHAGLSRLLQAGVDVNSGVRGGTAAPQVGLPGRDFCLETGVRISQVAKAAERS
jgi:hypothetical protein